jgi:hypothetical protein
VNNEGRDVLHEQDPGSNVAHNSLDRGPEPPFVGEAVLLPGHTEGLTREARCEYIHKATPRSAIEGVKVVPDRRWTKDPFLHSRDQIRGGKGFPLHVADGAVGIAEDEVEGELQPADPGT